MVDVSGKAVTAREAIATGIVTMNAEALAAIKADQVAKGDVLAVARIAGIQAAKRTGELIPLCHPLGLSSVTITFESLENGLRATAVARTSGQTGVEMEAMTATAVALLTIYDMAKAIDKAMIIGEIHLLSKSGGKSGDWRAP
jgi:cyclic pyranopterin phosphate synthase